MKKELKNSQIHKKTKSSSLFVINLQVLKRGSSTGCFPVNFTRFLKHLFCETSMIGCFWGCRKGLR